MTRRVLIPVEGRLVRDPTTYEALPAEGKAVEMNSYWQRKLLAGDVTEEPTAEPVVKPQGGK